MLASRSGSFGNHRVNRELPFRSSSAAWKLNRTPSPEDALMTSSTAAILIIACATGGSAYAQAQTPPDPGAAATPGSTNPSKSDPSTSTPALVSPPSANHAQGRLSAGTVVQTPAGESIGTVKDVVPDTRTGQPRYIV